MLRDRVEWGEDLRTSLVFDGIHDTKALCLIPFC